MEKLFPDLISVLVSVPMAYCIWQAHNLNKSPFRVGIYNFILAIAFAFLMLSPVGTVKVIGGAFACQFILAGVVHLIVNDRRAYKKNAKIWVNSMSLLMGTTSILMLVMDYPNTKSMLHGFIIGCVAGTLGAIFPMVIDAKEKTENL